MYINFFIEINIVTIPANLEWVIKILRSNQNPIWNNVFTNFEILYKLGEYIYK